MPRPPLMTPEELWAVLTAGVLVGLAVAVAQAWRAPGQPRPAPPADARDAADLAGDVEHWLRAEGY